MTMVLHGHKVTQTVVFGQILLCLRPVNIRLPLCQIVIIFIHLRTTVLLGILIRLFHLIGIASQCRKLDNIRLSELMVVAYLFQPILVILGRRKYWYLTGLK